MPQDFGLMESIHVPYWFFPPQNWNQILSPIVFQRGAIDSQGPRSLSRHRILAPFALLFANSRSAKLLFKCAVICFFMPSPFTGAHGRQPYSLRRQHLISGNLRKSARSVAISCLLLKPEASSNKQDLRPKLAERLFREPDRHAADGYGFVSPRIYPQKI